MDGVNTTGGAGIQGTPVLTAPTAAANPATTAVPLTLPLGVGAAAIPKPTTLPLTTGPVPTVSNPLVGKASDSNLRMSSSSGTVATPAVSNVPQVAPPIITRAAVSSEKVLDKRRLQELVKEVDPLEQLEDDVEEMLLQIADDFIDNVVTAGCQLARHRKSNTVEVKDIQLHLERNWNMWIPGFGSEELRPYKKAATTEAHKQRLALIKKTLKKY